MITQLQNNSFSAGQSSKKVQSLPMYLMYKARKLILVWRNVFRNKIQKYLRYLEKIDLIETCVYYKRGPCGTWRACRKLNVLVPSLCSVVKQLCSYITYFTCLSLSILIHTIRGSIRCTLRSLMLLWGLILEYTITWAFWWIGVLGYLKNLFSGWCWTSQILIYQRAVGSTVSSHVMGPLSCALLS